MTKEVVKVTYTYLLEYECKEHREYMLQQLEKRPVVSTSCGVGMVDGKSLPHSTLRKGTGHVHKKTKL